MLSAEDGNARALRLNGVGSARLVATESARYDSEIAVDCSLPLLTTAPRAEFTLRGLPSGQAPRPSCAGRKAGPGRSHD
jgi:hypothetical protein